MYISIAEEDWDTSHFMDFEINLFLVIFLLVI